MHKSQVVCREQTARYRAVLMLSLGIQLNIAEIYAEYTSTQSIGKLETLIV